MMCASLDLLLRPSYPCVTRGQGESLCSVSVKCVCIQCASVSPPLPVFAWPERDCIGHNGPQFAGWRVFPTTPCGTADVLMCPASVKWLSTAHCSAAAKRCTRLCMSALQKSSSLRFLSLSGNSELMIFIPLGMLDKFPLSPLTKHILGRVSFTPLQLQLLVSTGNWLFYCHIRRRGL